MNNTVSLWYLPIAVLKCSMFSIQFQRKQWDTCSYSVTVQYVGRMWSPTYWIRFIFLFFTLGEFAILQIKKEINILDAPSKGLIGHINHKFPKPIRYLYFFVTLYVAR